jgi:hypothetical protein
MILLLGFIAFANMLGNSFVWDDEEMVVKNFPVFHLKNMPTLFTQATFFSGGSTLSGWFYRPLVMTTFLLIHVVFGKNPLGYHLVQLALHLANAVLLFVVFNFLFEKINKSLTKPLSGLLALVYAVHPAHIEAVSYIASMAEPLYTFFLLVLFLIIVKNKRPSSSAGGPIWVVFLFLLALLTKEGAVVFLPIALVYLYLFQKKGLKKWLPPLSLGLIGYLVIRLSFFGFQTQKPHFLAPIAKASFGQRLLTVPLIFVTFLKTFFFPKVLAVSQHMVVRSANLPQFWLPLAASLLFVSLVLVFLIKTKSKLGYFFFFWFLISILPVLNVLMPLDMSFAERWLYFSMIGLLGLIGVFVMQIKKIHKNFALVALVFTVAIVLLLTRTIIRNKDWKDGFTLYSHDINLEPESFDLQNNLGVELFRQGKHDEALVHFEKSVELEPSWSISLNNLAVAYENKGEVQKARTLYERSIKAGDYYLAYENLASLILRQDGPQKALEFLDSALAKLPNNEKLNRLAAIAYYQTGDRALGLVFAKRAYSLNPTNINRYLYQTIRDQKELKF